MCNERDGSGKCGDVYFAPTLACLPNDSRFSAGHMISHSTSTSLTAHGRFAKISYPDCSLFAQLLVPRIIALLWQPCEIHVVKPGLCDGSQVHVKAAIQQSIYLRFSGLCVTFLDSITKELIQRILDLRSVQPCVLIARSMDRLGMDLLATCQSRFADHCWNGTTQNTPVYPYYDPDLLLDPALSFVEWNKTIWNAGK